MSTCFSVCDSMCPHANFSKCVDKYEHVSIRGYVPVYECVSEWEYVLMCEYESVCKCECQNASVF